MLFLCKESLQKERLDDHYYKESQSTRISFVIDLRKRILGLIYFVKRTNKLIHIHHDEARPSETS